MARGMVKQFSNRIPNFDMNAMTQRAIEMSKFDPYYSDKIDIRSHNTYQPQRTISDIFFDSPETVINACKVAVSQLSLTDELKESLEMIMKSWKIDLHMVKSVLDQAEQYRADIEA